MNICFASLSYPLSGETSSGVGTQIELLAQALVQAGHSISVIDDAGAAQTSRATTGDGVQVYRMRSGKLHWFASKLPLVGGLFALPLREIELSIAAWRGARRAQRIGKLDLIEGTETGMLFIAWFLKNVPLVIRLHGEQYTFLKFTPGSRMGVGLRLTRALQRQALRRAKLLISPSQAHAREIEKELGSSHPPIVVVPNALRETAADYAETNRSSNLVLYAGRIEERKGVRVLLEAAAQVKELIPQVRFVIAGGFHSSFPESEFRKLVEQLGLSDHVQLLGSIDWNDLTEWYRRATVCVLPSYYETFGLAALEPMMFGTPVIATSASALPEVVTDSTGLLIPAGESSALAKGIAELLQDPKRCRRMGNAGRERAATFAIDRLLPVNERLYRWSCALESVEPGPHIFLSPHADDVVLSCGGLINSLLSQRLPVEVISIFAGTAKAKDYTAFARHLHAKWGLTEAPLAERWHEDTAAMRKLGVTNFEHWNYSEAPYRKTADEKPLYTGYDEMMGPIAEYDREVAAEITDRLRRHIEQLPDTATVYCPLSLGNHVDHQLLYNVGLRLAQSGNQLRFYEDYPYASAYKTNGHMANWLPRRVVINLERKLDAAAAYASQIRGLGGSTNALAKGLKSFGNANGAGQTERYWELVAPDTAQPLPQATVQQPVVPVEIKPRLRDFKNYLATFKWHDVTDVLPVGTGRCLDVGCGLGTHRGLIEQRGFKWLGLDNGARSATVKASAVDLPFADESLSAVVASQVIEYVEQPELVFAEAARVIEPGGVICGSVSFLEPLHGHTYFNLSPLALGQLLRRHGFADIQIKGGLNGFALMAWTWLRRSGIPKADAFAIPIVFSLLAPVAAIIFFASWLNLRLGLGSGHAMRWLSERVPLDFAGHLLFVARKKARVSQ